MAAFTVTSSDFAPDAFDRFYENTEDVPMVKTEVVVTNGIAAVPPTFMDFSEWESIETQGTAWLTLLQAVENADRVLNSLNECNYPDLQARWTLYEMLQRIRNGADALEKYIA